MVFEYLRALQYPELRVIGTARKPTADFFTFDVYDDPAKLRQAFDGEIDYVINCVGITKPYCHDNNAGEVENATYINSIFPHRLAREAQKRGFRVIQIATDCVYSGTKGNYTEADVHDALDAYGKTKSLGEVHTPRMLHIRSSIIGPERYHKAFLLEWFLAQPEGGKVNGFDHHRWNGITTLQFAELCGAIVKGNNFDEIVACSNVHHFIPNNTVSKYELLCIFNTTFEKRLTVEKQTNDQVINRTLTSRFDMLAKIYPPRSMEEAIRELKEFIIAQHFYTIPT